MNFKENNTIKKTQRLKKEKEKLFVPIGLLQSFAFQPISYF
jgi:hypothetical protein